MPKALRLDLEKPPENKIRRRPGGGGRRRSCHNRPREEERTGAMSRNLLVPVWNGSRTQGGGGLLPPYHDQTQGGGEGGSDLAWAKGPGRGQVRRRPGGG